MRGCYSRCHQISSRRQYLFKIVDHYTKVSRLLSFISAGTVKYVLLFRIFILPYSLSSIVFPGHFPSKEFTISSQSVVLEGIQDTYFFCYFCHIKNGNFKNCSIMEENTLGFSRIVQNELLSSLLHFAWICTLLLPYSVTFLPFPLLLSLWHGKYSRRLQLTRLEGYP